MSSNTNTTPSFAVILAAAGRSSRFGDSAAKKPFVNLLGKPVWYHSARRFADRADVKQLIIVVAKEDCQQFESESAKLLDELKATVVAGGAERVDSVANGLATVDASIDFVAIHDAARPGVSPEVIEDAFDIVRRHSCVTVAIPVTSTVKRSTDGGDSVESTVDRSELFLAQTPQVFSRLLLQELYELRCQSKPPFQPTDEAQLAEHFGHVVRLARGCPLNLKLTTAQDLRIASALLSLNQPPTFDAPPDAGGPTTRFC